MAPEQTQGNDVDRRIDIFATGIVLHEILTGRRLFKGENDLQTVERVRQCDVAPPSLQNPLCPPELDAIVLRALARNRDERFQTSSEMADALDDVVHAARFQPAHLAHADARPVPHRGRRRRGAGHHDDVGLAVAPASPRACARPPSRRMTVPRHASPSRATLPRIDPLPTPPPQRSFMARGLDLGGAGAGRDRRGRRRVHHPQPAAGGRWSAATPERDPLPQEVRDRRALDPRRGVDLPGGREPVPGHDRHLPAVRDQGRRPHLAGVQEGGLPGRDPGGQPLPDAGAA